MEGPCLTFTSLRVPVELFSVSTARLFGFTSLLIAALTEAGSGQVEELGISTPKVTSSEPGRES